jgi:hypothetical protein
MCTQFYKNYTITTEATRDEITGQYTPVIRIAWQGIDDKRDTHSFIVPKQCSTLDEANSVGLEVAKAWADRHLVYLGP